MPPLINIFEETHAKDHDQPQQHGDSSFVFENKTKDEAFNTLTDICKAAKEHKQVFFYTNGEWNMHDLLLALTEVSGPARLYISTYAISEGAARMLSKLKEENIIKELHCIIDNRTDTRSSKSLQLLKNTCDSCVLVAVHSKLTVLVGEEMNLMVLGSANYTENKRLETGIVTSSSNGINFFCNVIKSTIKNG